MKSNHLTKCELSVITRLHLKTSEIAAELGIKPRTLEGYIESILIKSKQKTRTGAALWYYKTAKVDPALRALIDACSELDRRSDDDITFWLKHFAEKHNLPEIADGID